METLGERATSQERVHSGLVGVIGGGTMNTRIRCSLFIISLVISLAPATTAKAELFDPSVEYVVGSHPKSVTIMDLDGDDHQDLAVTNASSDNVTILMNTGDGTYTRVGDFGTGNAPWSIASGDLDGDGDKDLVTANLSSDDFSVLLGNGDGTFQTAVNYGTISGPAGVGIGDLDRDGYLDLAVTHSGLYGKVSVFLGVGDGTFESAMNFDVGARPYSVSMGDFNTDGIPDLATANSSSGNVSVLQGNGDSTFGTAVQYEVGDSPVEVTNCDLNGDSIPDLAVANWASYSVSILIGNGDGTFQTAVDYIVSLRPTSVTISDVIIDGYPDLAVTNDLFDNVMILRGIGDGTFIASVVFEVGEYPTSVASGDLDGDGAPDLVVANFDSDNVSVLINTTIMAKLVVGPGPDEGNSPQVRVFPPNQDALPEYEFSAYSANHYGVKVSSGDPDGDGEDEILTGAGPGEVFGPHVRGFDFCGTPVPGINFLAYGTNKYGVNVCAGDIDGDGRDEIITGAGPGAVFGPHVRAFGYDGTAGVTPVPGVSFFAYCTTKWGVNVAAGDIDGDGIDEIITGAGPGAVYGPHVRGWNVDGGAAVAIPRVSFLAYGTNRYGVNITAGDVDGDGIDETVTGAGPGAVFGPHVRGWNHDGSSVTPLPGYSFFAWQTAPLRFGVNVFAGADLNGDGRDELVAGRGPDPDADTEVKVFTYDGATVSQWISLEAYPGLRQGTNVAAGRF